MGRNYNAGRRGVKARIGFRMGVANNHLWTAHLELAGFRAGGWGPAGGGITAGERTDGGAEVCGGDSDL